VESVSVNPLDMTLAEALGVDEVKVMRTKTSQRILFRIADFWNSVEVSIAILEDDKTTRTTLAIFDEIRGVAHDLRQHIAIREWLLPAKESWSPYP